MTSTLAAFLKIIVEIVKNHGDRIEALEREEFQENADDANLMEEVNSLLSQLQIPNPSDPVPSDQL